MNELEFKPLAKQFLNQFGFEVYDIERKSGVQTPDFDVIGKNDRYTIELKIKDDDPNEIKNDEDALMKGEFVSKSIPIGPRNRFAGIVRKSVQQIMDHDPKGETYHVVWLHSAGTDPELHNRKFRSTLFGTEKLFSLRKSNILTCYYFYNSAFFSWRNYLDGVILTYSNNAQLCINSLSPRVNEFRESELATCMAKGLCDPDKIAHQSTDIMVADCEIDRQDSNLVLEYLTVKYKLDHLQTIPMNQITGMMAVSGDEES
jgi:hypothetical protein